MGISKIKNMEGEKMNKIISIIFSIFLPITILLLSVNIIAFNESFYAKKYDEYGIPSSTNIEKEGLMDLTNKLFKYLKGKEDNSYIEKYFNKKELIHLEDVRVLFEKGFVLRNISIIILLASFLYLIFKNPKNLVKYSMYSSIVSLGIVLAVFLLYLIDFNKYFTYFHLILFDNDLWLLNPNVDILIRIFPEQIFISLLNNIVLLFVIIMSIILVIAKLYSGRMKGKFE